MAEPPPLVALTGATGFIGRWIARHLVATGWRVRVLVRPGSEKRLPDLPLDICFGSLEDVSSLQSLLTDVQGVVHCAGVVRGISQRDFDAVNAAGTQRLAQVAADVGVDRWVMISSLAAREPQLSPYALSKRRGEQALQALGDRLPWIIFRPPAVYGPGDREMLPLLKAMARGIVPLIGDRDARFSLIYVEDLARAVGAALNASRVSEALFEIDDGHSGGYSWQEVIDIAAEYRNKPVRAVPVPEGLLRAMARLSLAASRLRGKMPMLTPAKVNELRHPDWVCDNTAVCETLEWQPQIPFSIGLAKTLAPDQSVS